MKKVIFCCLIFLLSAVVFGQEIKKMSIAELETYIRESNKPLVINFWATFCAPCIHEIPYFENIVKEKYDGIVELVLVSLDPRQYFPAKVASFASQKKFSSTILWLNETNAEVFCPKIDAKWSGAIPATLMVNNKKNYRKFYEQQLTPLQLVRELKLLAE